MKFFQALTTGIVGNFPLPRNAASPTAIETLGSKIFVALSSGGIACYNVFDALEVRDTQSFKMMLFRSGFDSKHPFALLHSLR